jgi:hypothetical protein
MTPAKKKPKKSSNPARRGDREYRFKIDAFTPETMPMARLAEYIRELAAILGEHKSVHLLRIEEGSTALVHAIEREAIPKIRARAEAVRRGDAPRDAQEAYRKVNRFLREDNATAILRESKTGPKILEFPGRDEAEDTFPSVNQFGSISAVLIRVGGVGDQIPVLLESEGQQIAGCHTNRHLAKNLAHHLFEPVRVSGQGYWMRDAEGEWNLNHFRIDSFEPLDGKTLSAALTELRAVAGDEVKGIYEDLRAIRRGRSSNGGD